MLNKSQKIPIDELRPGLILANDIHDEYGNLLLSAGLELSQSHVERLARLNLEYISVKTCSEEELSDTSSEKTIVDSDSLISDTRRSLKPINFGTEKMAAEQLDLLWAEAKISSLISQRIVDALIKLSRTIANEVRMRKNAAPLIVEPGVNFSTHTLHMLNGAILGCRISDILEKSQNEIYELSLAYLIYDIGKAKIPSRVLEKVDSLDENQMNLVKRHPRTSYEIAVNFNVLSENIEKAIHFHHENFDGSGYPAGISSGEIPFEARLIRAMDSYIAMCSDRPYRSRSSHKQTLTNILMGHGKSYDPEIVKLFVEQIGFYPSGTMVRLSDGSLAVVAEKASKDSPFSPAVKVFYRDGPLGESDAIDLSKFNADSLNISDEIL